MFFKGTQRLPRLIGLPNSLPMMLTGQQVRTAKAKKMGLVDETVDMLGPGVSTPEANTMNYLRSCAVKKAAELAEKGKKSIKRKVGCHTTYFPLFVFHFCRNEDYWKKCLVTPALEEQS